MSLTESDISYGYVVPLSGSSRPLQGKNVVQIVRSALRKYYSREIEATYVDTDVACAALGESFQRYTDSGRWINDDPNQVMVFVKASLGIGGAICQAARPFAGMLHSEMGQIYVRRWIDPCLDPNDDEATFMGLAPYFGRLESLASVPAIEARFGEKFELLARTLGHPAWEREAYYLAQLCMAVVAIVAPTNIILGGRIMGVPGLLDQVKEAFRSLQSGGSSILAIHPHPSYSEVKKIDFIDVARYTKPGRPGRPGVLGALLFAAVRSRSVEPEIVSVVNLP